MKHIPLVEIVCDGNEQIGYGHIRRSTALALHLKKNNIHVRLMGLSEAARERLPVLHDSDQDASVIVLDSFQGLDPYIIKAREKGQINITLDWFGNTVPDINIVVYPHQKVNASLSKYIGFEYIILRHEITNKLPVDSTGGTKKVLVCLGGADILNQGHKTAAFLSSKGFDTTLVQGPFAKNQSQDDNFKVVTDPPDLPLLLTETEWVVTNGGGCFFEALYLGKPAFVLPQTEFEHRIAKYAEEHNAVLGIGIKELKDYVPHGLKSVSKNGRKLIDGHGLDRIVRIIEGKL